MKLTDWIAIAALFISLSSLAVSLRALLRDRYKLRLDGYMLLSSSQPLDVMDIVVTVTNEGRRPISIISVYYETNLNAPFPLRHPIHGDKPDKLDPIPLEENEIHRFILRDMTYSEAIKLPPIIDICVEVSNGKVYHVKIENDALLFNEELDA